MKKSSKSKSAKIPKVDPYLEGVVAKLLDRLAGLERKVDRVISQTAGKSSGGGDHAHSSHNHQPSQPPRKDRTLYEAICADCHKVCEVPFRPSEARPVYCKTCFAKRRSGGGHTAMPVLTAVALSPKPVSKLGMSQPSLAPAPTLTKKPKKIQSAKKTKKKK
ncbi:MAG: CxxC-x17-CxxC domain-containing protein [Candidatus Omnitrophota bacterium]